MERVFAEPFQCRKCGNCCRGDGYVLITQAEAEGISAYLGLARDEFLAQYTKPPMIGEQRKRGDLWLVDHPGPVKECVFLENARCRIQEVKPAHCKKFPTRWRTKDTASYCEGLRESDPE